MEKSEKSGSCSTECCNVDGAVAAKLETIVRELEFSDWLLQFSDKSCDVIMTYSDHDRRSMEVKICAFSNFATTSLAWSLSRGKITLNVKNIFGFYGKNTLIMATTFKKEKENKIAKKIIGYKIKIKKGF
jgi:hypothetical protein